jgi:hypothetical protein
MRIRFIAWSLVKVFNNFYTSIAAWQDPSLRRFAQTQCGFCLRMDKEGFHEYLARISRRSFSAGSPVTRALWISSARRLQDDNDRDSSLRSE